MPKILSYTVAALAAAAGLGAASISAAAVTVQAGPSAVQPAENVLLNGGASGSTALGVTNQTDRVVRFTGTEALALPSMGQARVDAVDGAFTELTFSLADAMLGFTQFEVNVNAAQNGSLTFFLTDQMNMVTTRTLNLDGNGQNFFGGLATDGSLFSSVRIVSTVQLEDVGQVRLGGIGRLDGGIISSPGIPEPATWAMMIGGLGIVGGALRRRKLAVA